MPEVPHSFGRRAYFYLGILRLYRISIFEFRIYVVVLPPSAKKAEVH